MIEAAPVRRHAMPASTRQKFRAMLKPGAALILPGVANALAARVVADCGFDAAYITGAGIANSFLGIPDNGLVTLTELTDHVVAIREVFAGPADGRCRHRLRQRAQHAAHRPGAGARRRRRNADRGPGVPEALRPFRGQGGHSLQPRWSPRSRPRWTRAPIPIC